MRVLVTGGAGFIGSQYVRAMINGELPGSEDCQVTVVDKLTYSGNRNNLRSVIDSPRLTFVHGDTCDAPLVNSVVSGHDAIVHMAAETHVDRSLFSAGEFINTNILGTQVLLEAALRSGVTRFLHVSTDEVYGSIEHGSWDEQTPIDPNVPYAAAKAGSDVMVMAYHRTFGLDVCITRCTNNYGPFQFPEKVIPRFVTNLIDGLNVPLYGDGLNRRDWLHVKDHCRAIQMVLRGGRSGQIYHVGGGSELTNLELTEVLLETCGAGWERVDHVPDRQGHDRRYSLDITKIQRELGYQPTINFAEGIRETVSWYIHNRDWWEPLRDRCSVEQRRPQLTTT